VHNRRERSSIVVIDRLREDRHGVLRSRSLEPAVGHLLPRPREHEDRRNLKGDRIAAGVTLDTVDLVLADYRLPREAGMDCSRCLDHLAPHDEVRHIEHPQMGDALVDVEARATVVRERTRLLLRDLRLRVEDEWR
jgi:hypothetical protein